MLGTTAASLRLVLYARVSTEEQRDGQTINSQIAELERFASAQGADVVDIYKDSGWSGSAMARPALDRLRDDAQAGRFQAVLINDVDRLARDVTHLGIIKRDLERQKVQVIFRKLPSDASPVSNLMINILGSFAEFERELIIDRTRRGRRHKVEGERQYLGSITSYGYRYHRMDRIAGKNGKLEVEPDEAKIVQQIFEWVDTDGLSARRIAYRLNWLRIPPRKSTQWGLSTVLRILHNEMYTGLWHYNKLQCCEPRQRKANSAYRNRIKSSFRKRPREEWIPLRLPESLRLVSRDRWERVQVRLQRNICFSPRNEKHFYLLKGLIKCGGCSRSYIGDGWHGRHYYRCAARCGHPSIRDFRLNKIVIAALKAVVSEQDHLAMERLEQEELQEILRTTIQEAVFDGSAVTISRAELQ